MLTYVALGLSMGLSAGLSPGPLSALLIASSLRSGLAGGLRVAVAPLLTDLPIIALGVVLVDRMPSGALRWLGTVGGLVVAWMAVETLRAARSPNMPDQATSAAQPRRELWRGILVNATNPHPYLFWATVGAPILVKGWRTSPWYALAFLLSFYALLVGSKAVLAWLVSRGAGGLSGIWYRRMLAVSGALMLVMAGVLVRQAWVS